jgi:hypothetical protein
LLAMSLVMKSSAAPTMDLSVAPEPKAGKPRNKDLM